MLRTLLMLLPLLLTAVVARGDILFDQIGGQDGGSMAGDTWGSMHFLPPPTIQLDLAAVDNFTLTSERRVTAVEFILDGWYNFGGPEGVAAIEVNLYSGLEAAMGNIVGDILSNRPEPIVVASWEGPGWQIRLPVDITLSTGTYFMSVVMDNPYPENGWAGVATSTIGDGIAWQVSPGGDYVFSPMIEAAGNLAYRLVGSPVPTPASVGLLAALLLPSGRRRRQ